MMKPLFLNPPSFEGFDGGAGSRPHRRVEGRPFMSCAAAYSVDEVWDEVVAAVQLRIEVRPRVGDRLTFVDEAVVRDHEGHDDRPDDPRSDDQSRHGSAIDRHAGRVKAFGLGRTA